MCTYECIPSVAKAHGKRDCGQLALPGQELRKSRPARQRQQAPASNSMRQHANVETATVELFSRAPVEPWRCRSDSRALQARAPRVPRREPRRGPRGPRDGPHGLDDQSRSRDRRESRERRAASFARPSQLSPREMPRGCCCLHKRLCQARQSLHKWQS